MLYCENLEKKVFERPSSIQVDNFSVVSGYLSPEPIKELESLPHDVHATVIYGMYGKDGIKEPLHKALVNLHQSLPNVEILYCTVPVHSKIYFWNKGAQIASALIGSANFSVSGLRNDLKEVLYDVDEKSFDEFEAYYKQVREKCILCTDKSVKVRVVEKIKRTNVAQETLLAKNICRASFLDNKGLIPKKSGLNWCFSRGNVSRGDAYIPISMKDVRMYPQMFPPKKYVEGIENPNAVGKKKRDNDQIELIWDDGKRMIGLLEGQVKRKSDGLIFPKNLASSPQKSILGIYLRERIGVSLDKVITKKDLIKYGRTHIDISLIGDGVYYMDFSVNKK